MVELHSAVQEGQPQTAVPGENITVVVLDSCHYPSPPKKTEFVVSKADTVDTLRNRIATECGYPKDAIEAKCGKISFDESNEDKILKDLGFSSAKIIVSLSKKHGSKVPFPNLL